MKRRAGLQPEKQRADNKRETACFVRNTERRERRGKAKKSLFTHSLHAQFPPALLFPTQTLPLNFAVGFPAPGAAARLRSGSPDPPLPHSPALGGSLPQLLALSRSHSETAKPGRLGQNRAGSGRAAAALCRPRRRPRLRGGVDGTALLGTAPQADPELAARSWSSGIRPGAGRNLPLAFVCLSDSFFFFFFPCSHTICPRLSEPRSRLTAQPGPQGSTAGTSSPQHSILSTAPPGRTRNPSSQRPWSPEKNSHILLFLFFGEVALFFMQEKC